jgi:hypothetical protein
MSHDNDAGNRVSSVSFDRRRDRGGHSGHSPLQVQAVRDRVYDYAYDAAAWVISVHVGWLIS